MKTKHTPGPWKITDPFDNNTKRASVYWKCIKDQSGITLAEVKGRHYGTKNTIAEANAKLIAAAPEMLNNLYNAEAFLLDHTGIDQTMDRLSPKVLLQFIQTAIQKATS